MDVNPFNGSANISVPIPLTQGRSGFGPALALQYSSTAGNSIFGVGWSLSGLSSIGLSSKKLPKYDGKDHFVFNGSEELVPMVKDATSGESEIICNPEQQDYWIHYYRAKVENNYTRFEKWVHKETGRIHWRTREVDNSITVFGYHESTHSTVCDQNNNKKTYQWLIEAKYDDNGNAIIFEYLPENKDNIDSSQNCELSRVFSQKEYAQRYIKRIRYGNSLPLNAESTVPDGNDYFFQVVFDYGDHRDDPTPSTTPNQQWKARLDSFSTFRPGFEIRTHRICQRVMMFHQFSQLGSVPAPVSVMSFDYRDNPAGTTMVQIKYCGYRTDIDSGEISHLDVPPLSLTYTKPTLERSFNPIPESSCHNFPEGLSSTRYRWMDLYGVGLPGVLYETNQAWYYKDNLGGGLLGEQTMVATKPSNLVGTYALSDFDSDGNPNLVVFSGRQAGYCEFDRDNGQWLEYRPFSACPALEDVDADVHWIDLTGDGCSDIIISKQDRFTWYPSEGKNGFGEPIEFTNMGSKGFSHLKSIEEDPSLKYMFADMTGDGLLDQVRIQNGRIEYWPQLGNGHFGEVILMDNPPVFDFDTQFDFGRLKLADLDGSGTSDLIYIGHGEVSFWINAGGNAFIEGLRLSGLPYIDNLSSVQIFDFFGNGTSCLVWSSPLASQTHNPVQYIQLTGGIHPRQLLSVNNNMGMVTNLTYSTSAQHYLRDKSEGRTWISKLPNHSTVVDRIEVIDQIGKTRFCSSYEYHDGFFDSGDRVFRGFGQVDQYDTETFNNLSGQPEREYTGPACTRSFFHNGALGWDDKRSCYHYSGDPDQASLPGPHFESQLDFRGETLEEGYRSLAGQLIRQEIFAVNTAGRRAEHPFQVTQNTFRLRQLQKSDGENDACFTFFQSESLVYEYEQNSEDPRITHELILTVDNFGNPLETCSIAYPRRSSIPERLAEQKTYYCTASTNQYHHFNEIDHLETGIPIENKQFELILHEIGTPIIGFDKIKSGFSQSIDNYLEYHNHPNPEANGVVARLLQWDRNFYWNDNLQTALPHGSVGVKTLLHHQESACFSNQLATEIFEEKVTSSILEIDGHYDFKEGYWWQASPVLYYSPAHTFYTPASTIRIDGGETIYISDPYYLILEEIVDAVGNRISSNIDYNVIAPCRIVDPNENVAEVCYDPLGMIIFSTIQGSALGPSGTTEKYGHDLLSEYDIQPDWNLETLLAEPERFLQGIGHVLFYNLHSWKEDSIEESSPTTTLALVREQWAYNGTGRPSSESSIQIGLTYFDGFGRPLQSKQRVEAGLAIHRDETEKIVLDAQGFPIETETIERWLVSGHTVYNNKQLTIKQYEPFFSPDWRFEADEELNTFGVSTLSIYDALGREIRTELPNGCFTKVEMTPWEIKSSDPNDTVDTSAYGISHALLPKDTPEYQSYEKTLAHAKTPIIVRLDPLGREIEQVETSNDGINRVTRTQLDLLGNVQEITDPRGLVAFQYIHDMHGKVLHEMSIDSGESLRLQDAFDRPAHHWDGRGVHKHFHFDMLDRPTSVFVDGALGLNQITEKMEYCDNQHVENATERNLRGQLVVHYDQAGVKRVHQYSLEGNPSHIERRLLRDYKSEPDWGESENVELDQSESFVSKMEYDALGRSTLQQLPDGTTRKPSYHQSGNISRLGVTTDDGFYQDTLFLKEVSYNARGQRTQILLGNDVSVSYEYDKQTFQLKRLLSTGSSNRRTYQDVSYTYDPVGNITHHIDMAQQPETGSLPVLEGLGVSTHCDYTYDSLYKLKRATGRLHQALHQHHYLPGSSAPRIKGTQHLSLNNGAAIERYERKYGYDISGNILHIQHLGATTSSPSWATNIWTSPTSNRSLQAEDQNNIPISSPESCFDANGNCIFMPHIRTMEWNYRNNLARAVIIDRTEQNRIDDAEYYVYGGDGMRVRKVHERIVSTAESGTSDQIEITEKIYLDGCEIKRVRRNDIYVLERTTSHISDGNNRIAILHQWIRDDLARETDDIAQKKTHYQLSNYLGSSSLELDTTGRIISYEEYFPFGGSAFIAGDSAKEIKIKEYRYSGKERDDQTGFYYYGYRYYIPWIGNWLSPDPIGPEDGFNLYLFVRNNPVNLVDPNGLHCGRCLPPRRSSGTRGRRSLAEIRRQDRYMRSAPSSPPPFQRPPLRGQTTFNGPPAPRATPSPPPRRPPRAEPVAIPGPQPGDAPPARVQNVGPRATPSPTPRTEPVAIPGPQPGDAPPARVQNVAPRVTPFPTPWGLPDTEGVQENQFGEVPPPRGDSTAGSFGRNLTIDSLQEAELDRSQVDKIAPIERDDLPIDGTIVTINSASGTYQFIEQASISPSNGEDVDIIDALHTTLGIAGMAPAYGIIFDALDILLYVGEGDIENASISGIAFIPVIGIAVTALRRGRTGTRLLLAHSDQISERASSGFRQQRGRSRSSENSGSWRGTREVDGEVIVENVGEFGEHVAEVTLRRDGWSILPPVKNNSDNGIDIIAVSPRGHLGFFEIKTTGVGRVPDVSDRQASSLFFIYDILENAAEGRGRYRNISEPARRRAERLRDQFRSAMDQELLTPGRVSTTIIGVDLKEGGHGVRVSNWSR